MLLGTLGGKGCKEQGYQREQYLFVGSLILRYVFWREQRGEKGEQIAHYPNCKKNFTPFDLRSAITLYISSQLLPILFICYFKTKDWNKLLEVELNWADRYFKLKYNSYQEYGFCIKGKSKQNWVYNIIFLVMFEWAPHPSAGKGWEREKCLKVKILLCTSLMFSILGSLVLYRLNVINFVLRKQFYP